MKVAISRHAIDRFKQRSKVAREDFQIVRLLTAMVLLKNPVVAGAWRLVNRGLVLVGVTENGKATVKSCWFIEKKAG